jgi:hypothetical protein
MRPAELPNIQCKCSRSPLNQLLPSTLPTVAVQHDYAVLFSTYFVLVYFDDMHQLLVELPQGVGGLAILFVFIFISLYAYHEPAPRRAPPRSWWPCYFVFILVYIHITNRVLVGLPQGAGDLAILVYFILVYW